MSIDDWENMKKQKQETDNTNVCEFHSSLFSEIKTKGTYDEGKNNPHLKPFTRLHYMYHNRKCIGLPFLNRLVV